MSAPAPIVLGIDPGLKITGYGLITTDGAKIRLVEAGTIEGGDSGVPLTSRLRNLYAGLTSLLDEYRPQAVAMEQLYSHYGHPRTAILMAHARGVLTLAAAMSEATVADYSATQVKASLTGNGRGSKEQVQRAVRERLHLDSDPQPADIADALAVALCHLHHCALGTPA